MTEGQIEVDEQNANNLSEVDASPAKRFFVEMLTRDIELPDAILDLLDNCVDGAMRSPRKDGATDEKPFLGYFADIYFSPDEFRIKDNCGGIPHDLAKKYALRLGRPDPERDAHIATVGVYGIGMKRAIFKLGTESIIYSNHAEGAFLIPISSDWLDDDKNWKLTMQNAQSQDDFGTEITVKSLRDSVKTFFDPAADDFQTRFVTTLVKHYSYIIEKGFKVRVNEVDIVPKIPKFLFDISALTSQNGILPYIYETSIEGVDIKLIMGMYAKLPTEQEVEDGVEGKRNKNEAGWTVICNDRIVLENDKTHLTGWGEARVPHYHSQFISIAGVVSFQSNDARKLPVKTTKRGIDLDSSIYAMVKEQMREALKIFTSFTNKWKSDTPERIAIQANAEAIDIRNIAEIIPKNSWKSVLKGAKGIRFVPELPEGNTKRTSSRIVFIRPKTEIDEVRTFLGLDDDSDPSQVGSTAFESILNNARKK